MIIKYNVEAEDHLKFNEYHFEHSPTMRRIKRVATIYSPLSIFIALSLVGIIEKSWAFPIVGFIVSSIYAFGAPRRLQKRIQRTTEKFLSEGSNKGAFGEQQLELREDGIYNTSPSGTQTTFWDAVERIKQTETHGFIYISSTSAHVIPSQKIIEGNFDDFMQSARNQAKVTPIN